MTCNEDSLSLLLGKMSQLVATVPVKNHLAFVQLKIVLLECSISKFQIHSPWALPGSVRLTCYILFP